MGPVWNNICERLWLYSKVGETASADWQKSVPVITFLRPLTCRLLICLICISFFYLSKCFFVLFNDFFFGFFTKFYGYERSSSQQKFLATALLLALPCELASAWMASLTNLRMSQSHSGFLAYGWTKCPFWINCFLQTRFLKILFILTSPDYIRGFSLFLPSVVEEK